MTWMMMVEIKSGKGWKEIGPAASFIQIYLYPPTTLFDKCFDYNDLQRDPAK